MRAILGAALLGVLVVVAGAGADDKSTIDPAKLIGKWSKEAPTGKGAKKGSVKTWVTEYTEDGKWKTTPGGSGTYKLNGNKLTTTSKVGDKDFDFDFTIKSLTDDKLIIVDPIQKGTVSFKRVK